MTDSEPGHVLPAWVEAEFANRRRFWTTLRDGGALTPADEAEAIRRQVQALGDLDGLRERLRQVDEHDGRETP